MLIVYRISYAIIPLPVIAVLLPSIVFAQNTGDLESSIISDIEPVDNTVGPVANVGAEYKFDEGFYQKIQDLIKETPQEGDPGVYDGTRYYSVILVVTRDDNDDRTGDETAKENKDALVKRLELLGARDIVAAESLSFVTASIPVGEVPGFSLHNEVFKLGDGELPIFPDVDTARVTIRATPADLPLAHNRQLTGNGIVVAVVDTGINSVHLNDRVRERIYCPDGTCWAENGLIMGQSMYDLGVLNSTTSTHGTQVAQVLAAAGMLNHNGIAPGVTLLDAMWAYQPAGGGVIPFNSHTFFVHSIDWAYSRGAEVTNISANSGNCNSHNTASSLIVNEAIDKGMVIVKSASNRGSSYNSITHPGCANNVITVGGINDRVPGTITMYISSSRGPTSDGMPILKPEIVAPAVQIQTLVTSIDDTTRPLNGTSFAAPQVSATVALMLETEPSLTPAEIKALLLLGANWTGPIPCTSTQYEQNNRNDNCSFARQPTDLDTANNAASLGILNNVGFGILNTAQSVRYSPSVLSNVVSDNLDSSGITSKRYTFTVTDTSEPIKIILTWLVHPHGSITEQIDRTVPVPVANLNFSVRCNGGQTISATSQHQTNEFVVFRPLQTGTCTVTVTGSGLDTINKPVQNYALASTRPLTPVLPSNSLPYAFSDSIIVSPGIPSIVYFTGSDSNRDSLSFSVTREPTQGVITSDEFITKTHSRAMYTPFDNFTGRDTFQITPSDGVNQRGTPATITLVAETLPPNSKDVPTSSDNIRDWDTSRFSSNTPLTTSTKAFTGPTYPVSAIYLGSVNVEGGLATFTTSDGNTYRAAVPPSGIRMFEFPSPITINTMTLSSEWLDEQAAHNITKQNVPVDVRIFAGYAPSACASLSGASGSNSCPAYTTQTFSATPNIAIPDSTSSQDATSTIHISDNGTIRKITVSVDITHSFIGDLKVILTSPSGTAITLHDRSGSAQNDIERSYTTELSSLINTQIKGDWVLSVGDYASSDIGKINSWSIYVEHTRDITAIQPIRPSVTTIFSDDFEQTLSKWTETGEGDWRITTPSAHNVPNVPSSALTNKVLHSDNCDDGCTLTLTNSLDLSQYSSAKLSFWRFVDSGLDGDEYLKVELYNGRTWNTIYHWSHNLNNDDNRWNMESYDLSSYLVSNFKIRLTTQQSNTIEDVQLDDIKITSGTSSSTPSNSTSPQYSIYVADTDDDAIVAFTSDGTYIADIVPRGRGGLDFPMDVIFDSNGNMYVSDLANKKIRKYSSTGSTLDADWATTNGTPRGMTWNGDTLYVATSKGVERFSQSGSALGFFGAAIQVTNPSQPNGLYTPVDVIFCNNKMYVSDVGRNQIFYYSESTGALLGKFSSGTGRPDLNDAKGLECGTGIIGSGTSLYQSGDDRGQVNEINYNNGLLIREFTSMMNDPYLMDMDSAGNLYIANKDDDNIIKISQTGTVTEFADDTLDDPRGVRVGPVYRTVSGSDSPEYTSDNDQPEFDVLLQNGTRAHTTLVMSLNSSMTLYVNATDPQNDPITINIIPELIPESNISMNDNKNGTGTVTIDTTSMSIGSYLFWIKVSDNIEFDQVPFLVNVQ